MAEIVLRRDLDALRQKVRKALRSRCRTMAMIEMTIRRIVEAGHEFIRCKGEQEHGQFEAMLEEQGVIGDGADAVSRPTVARWMRLARFDQMNPGVLDKAQTISKAYRLAGILPDIEENTCGSSTSGSNYLVHLNRLSATLTAQLKARPLSQWSREDKAIARDRLRPLVEIYEELSTP